MPKLDLTDEEHAVKSESAIEASGIAQISTTRAVF
jgi:hypothetical protein